MYNHHIYNYLAHILADFNINRAIWRTIESKQFSQAIFNEQSIQMNEWINNQRRAIRREFEPVGPTLLKNPLGAGWGLLPTLQWMGFWLLPT